MNLSGKAVKYWVDKEKLDLTALMVIYDELAIPLSRLKIRPLGGAGGHNGLKSIEALLGTQEYPRIRFGVGNDYPRGSQVDFVLGQFSPAEKNIVQKKMETCVLALEDFVLSGIESAMNRVNNLVFEG